MDKKSEIISVKKVLMLTAELSPKWWEGASDRTGQNSLKLVHSHLKCDHDRKKIRSEIMQCIRTIFVIEIVNCFLDVFFKSPKFISILHPRYLHYIGHDHPGLVPVIPEEGMGTFSRNLSFSIPPSEPVI